MSLVNGKRLGNVSRRQFASIGGGLFSWGFLPKFARAADARDPRLIVIILRGALDGLSAVAPLADPNYARLHGALALTNDGPSAALPLDSFFSLNPAMPVFARLYKEKQASIVHAVATPYRERSHFDGQDVLESGFLGPGQVGSGWLNRLLEVLPRGDRVNERGKALAVGPTTPLILRGPEPIIGWAPTGMIAAGDDVAHRLMDLYRVRDPAFAEALEQGLGIEKIMGRNGASAKFTGGNVVQNMRQVAQGAARLLAVDDGPRIGALAFDGWDTHFNEGGATGRLAQLLSGLDGAFEEFETVLGSIWRQTVIIVATEFGRTVRINGTVGTDHGTGTVAFLAGGALQGGRVIADWPGLREAQLYEKRDLMPTSDLRSVFKGVLADHLGVSKVALGERVFPGSLGTTPLKGLIV